jgi:hypothetical protein
MKQKALITLFIILVALILLGALFAYSGSSFTPGYMTRAEQTYQTCKTLGPGEPFTRCLEGTPVD